MSLDPRLQQYLSPHTLFVDFVANHRDPDASVVVITCSVITLWDPSKSMPATAVPIASLTAMYVQGRHVLIRSYGREDVWITSERSVKAIAAAHKCYVEEGTAMCPVLPIFTIEAQSKLGDFVRKATQAGRTLSARVPGLLMCPCSIKDDDIDEADWRRAVVSMFICYSPSRLDNAEEDFSKYASSKRRFLDSLVTKYGPVPGAHQLEFVWKQRVRAMYEAYNNTKLCEVDTILSNYSDNKMELLRALLNKYGPDPTEVPPAMQVSWWESEITAHDPWFRTVPVPAQLSFHTIHAFMVEPMGLGTAACTVVVSCSSLIVFIANKRVRVLPVARVELINILKSNTSLLIRVRGTSDVVLDGGCRIVLRLVEIITFLHSMYLTEGVTNVAMQVMTAGHPPPSSELLNDPDWMDISHMPKCPCWPKEVIGEAAWRNSVTSLYLAYAPERLYTMEKDFEEYSESRQELLDLLVTKHGAVPSPQEVETVWKLRVRSLYEQYEPKKLADIDSIYIGYSERKVDLLRSLMDKYCPTSLPASPSKTQSPPHFQGVKKVQEPDIILSDVRSFQRRICGMFIVYDPSHLCNVEELYAMYGSVSEDDIIAELVAEYGPEPTEKVVLETWANRVKELYQQYDPTKLVRLPEILAEYDSRRMELLRALINKYSPGPSVAGEKVKEVDLNSTLRTQSKLNALRRRSATLGMSTYIIWQQRVADILVYYDPARLCNIDEVYALYETKDDEAILQDLIAQYGPEPTQEAVTARWATRVRQIYEEHCPAKLPYVDSILEQYGGAKLELLRSLMDKYIAE